MSVEQPTTIDEIAEVLATRPEKVMPYHWLSVKEGNCWYCATEGTDTEAVGEMSVQVNYVEKRTTGQEDYEALWKNAEEYLATCPDPELTSTEISLVSYLQMLYKRGVTLVKRPVCESHYTSCRWCSESFVTPDHTTDVVFRMAPMRHEPGWRWNSLDYPSSNDLCRSCEQDAYACSRCGDWTHSDDSENVNDNDYCRSCVDDLGDIFWCEGCETGHWSSGDCPNGYGHPDRLGRVHDYSYKPVPIFRNVDGARVTEHPVFMGFELEMELNCNSRNDLCDVLNEAFGDEENYVYYKYDGSLDDGVEVVSHPATLEFHQSQPWKSTLEKITGMGVRSWQAGTCGLHIHISRASFENPSHIWKFTHFIVDNKASMVKLAGRNSDRWATFDGYYEFKGILNRAKGSRSYNRYEALNFQNRNTIELRFFKGSLHPRRFFAALELTEGVCEYTRNLTSQQVKDGALNFSAFSNWVNLNPEKYSHLISLINHYSLSEMPRYKHTNTLIQAEYR